MVQAVGSIYTLSREIVTLEQQRVGTGVDDIQFQHSFTTAILSEGLISFAEALQSFSDSNPDWSLGSALKNALRRTEEQCT